MLIRAEARGDRDAVHDLNVSAFETSAEARLVDALRGGPGPLISLVAVAERDIVGHIMFSPVTLTGHGELAILGLAPMAVAPKRQRQGIGSSLVRAGLKDCERRGIDAVFVLGHPGYYPRFGFVPASRFAIGSEFNVPEDVFLARQCKPGTLEGRTGTLRYGPAFATL